MKEHPIPFSGAMVRAILDGRKTVTRRIIKPPRDENAGSVYELFDNRGEVPDGHGCFGAIGTNEGRSNYGVEFRCPYGQPGDRLWVRETWRPAYHAEFYCCVEYRADGARIKPAAGSLTEDQGHRFADDCPDESGLNMKWRPSIFMPRWASRITLEVTGVRVERVQDIDNNGAMAEGAPDLRTMENNWDMRDCFRDLWDSINAKRGHPWAVNPWVWVIEFMKVEMK